MPDDLISVDQHLERILEAITPLPDFPQPLMETLGLSAADLSPTPGQVIVR